MIDVTVRHTADPMNPRTDGTFDNFWSYEIESTHFQGHYFEPLSMICYIIFVFIFQSLLFY